jgi:hypothetical protein
MPKTILMDEFYLKVFVPDRLDPTECRAIRRVLSSKTFRAALGRALRALFSRYPSLAKTRIKIAA